VNVNSATDQFAGLADEELARRAQRGSMNCFEELVRRFQIPLMRLLLRKTPSRADAEDILQDAFVRAFERIDQYSDRWPFRTWIFTIAHRQAISRHRSNRPMAGPEAMDDARSQRPSPRELADRNDQHRCLWNIARNALSDEQFTALWLYYVEEMPAPQIATVLARSWVSVKTMLHRARKTLMPLLSGMAAAQFGDDSANHALKQPATGEL
jgi:RNA polymerase sigma-70 factor (ECF subfamily)